MLTLFSNSGYVGLPRRRVFSFKVFILWNAEPSLGPKSVYVGIKELLIAMNHPGVHANLEMGVELAYVKRHRLEKRLMMPRV